MGLTTRVEGRAAMTMQRFRSVSLTIGWPADGSPIEIRPRWDTGETDLDVSSRTGSGESPHAADGNGRAGGAWPRRSVAVAHHAAGTQQRGLAHVGIWQRFEPPWQAPRVTTGGTTSGLLDRRDRPAVCVRVCHRRTIAPNSADTVQLEGANMNLRGISNATLPMINLVGEPGLGGAASPPIAATGVATASMGRMEPLIQMIRGFSSAEVLTALLMSHGPVHQRVHPVDGGSTASAQWH